MKISISSLQIFSHSSCHLKTWHSWGYFSKNNRTGTFKNFISELVYSNNEHLWNDKKNLQLFNQHMFQTLKNFQEWKRMFDINFSNYLSIVEPFLCTPFIFMELSSYSSYSLNWKAIFSHCHSDFDIWMFGSIFLLVCVHELSESIFNWAEAVIYLIIVRFKRTLYFFELVSFQLMPLKYWNHSFPYTVIF